jgi:hypothetical protein
VADGIVRLGVRLESHRSRRLVRGLGFAGGGVMVAYGVSALTTSTAFGMPIANGSPWLQSGFVLGGVLACWATWWLWRPK